MRMHSCTSGLVPGDRPQNGWSGLGWSNALQDTSQTRDSPKGSLHSASLLILAWAHANFELGFLLKEVNPHTHTQAAPSGNPFGTATRGRGIHFKRGWESEPNRALFLKESGAHFFSLPGRINTNGSPQTHFIGAQVFSGQS